MEKAIASKAGALIIPDTIIEFSKPAIRVNNPRLAFAVLLQRLTPPIEVVRGVHPSATIGKNVTLGNNIALLANVVLADKVTIGDNTIVYPCVYIGEESIVGKDCLIYPNVTLRERTLIGDRVIIQSGAVIGSDGFGFVTVAGQHLKVPQVGNVVIEDDVEIGANTCIDRATTSSTIIKRGTKIDNQVHIAHNDVIGEHCLIAAQTGVSGSVTVGHHVTLAGQTGTTGHIKIGDNSVFIGRAGITKDIPPNSFCAGVPARPHQEWAREQVALHKLPDALKRIRDLEKRLQVMEQVKS